jgi:hypothetical protein
MPKTYTLFGLTKKKGRFVLLKSSLVKSELQALQAQLEFYTLNNVIYEIAEYGGDKHQ